MPATRIVAGRIDIVEPGEAPRPYERFVITLNPDGGRTLRTVTRSPAGDLLRDVNMMVDRDWRPVEGVGRLFLKGELAGTVLRRVFPGRLDSYYWRPGEPMDHAVLEAPANMTLGFHPITGDAWKTNLMSTDHAEPQEVVVYTVSNTWFGGTLGHGHLLRSSAVYEGREDLELPVGVVPTERFLWTPRPGKELRIWRTGEARLLARMEVVSGERPGSCYQLAAVEEELVAE
ncbi:hypothetical protein [Phenylobacterium sp. SCN 70-31]|uniref:hypothetical protein n=1 Tax=Phenylobacterium sp. SCN 70-31 TaxID=1660129 RepID=UPI00086D95E5|nr:hypothetical protein [Phenylobacterium sp. SCN 70-31]ODT88358.1 MAG: hypothetical protein ABS78_06995 [Phenylobacterium sp. SCN 70-31]